MPASGISHGPCPQIAPTWLVGAHTPNGTAAESEAFCCPSPLPVSTVILPGLLTFVSRPRAGFVYVAFCFDVFSRMING
jgi:hypothetical protein